MVRTARWNGWISIKNIQISCWQKEKPIIVTVRRKSWKKKGRVFCVRERCRGIWANAEA